MRSRKEIENFLKKKEYNNNLINEIITRLGTLDLINDEKYIKAYILDKINLTNDGPYKIKQNLLNEKMDESLVEKYISEIDKEELSIKLERLIDKKIPTIKNCSGNVLKYKIVNYFINLGYDKYMIEEILDNKNLNTNDGEKEYKKLYNKYARKYSGYELESIIRQKLYQKGFDLNEIKKNID